MIQNYKMYIQGSFWDQTIHMKPDEQSEALNIF